MTDVTGFGLLGHLHELASASGVAAEVDAGAVPAHRRGARAAGADEPPIAGGTRRNRDWVEDRRWPGTPAVPEELRWLLCDAMTSGGLLVAAPPGAAAPGRPDRPRRDAGEPRPYRGVQRLNSGSTSPSSAPTTRAAHGRRRCWPSSSASESSTSTIATT